MDLVVRSRTDTGRVRDQNEDAVLTDLPFVAVADGMGGHAGGEVASALALETLSSAKDRLEGHSGREAADILKDLFSEINRAVFEKSQEDPALSGMGTTLTAAWINDRSVSLAHVGDSRAYLLRGGKLEQLTEDQNVAQELVRRGRLSKEEAASSPHRHVMLQAIGVERDDLDVETMTLELKAGDRFVLMSDGLYGMVSDPERLRALLTNPDGDEACAQMIDAANAAGGQDNISVVIVDVPGDGTRVADEDEVDDSPIVVDRGSRRAAPPPVDERRRFPRPALVIGGAILLLAAMAVLFLVRPTADTYVLSARRGNLVVLRGTPGTPGDPARGEVVRRFREWETKEFPAPTRRQLLAGIEVDSISDAEDRIRKLPRTQGPQDTPTPKPTSKPKPSPDVTPAATPRAP